MLNVVLCPLCHMCARCVPPALHEMPFNNLRLIGLKLRLSSQCANYCKFGSTLKSKDSLCLPPHLHTTDSCCILAPEFSPFLTFNNVSPHLFWGPCKTSHHALFHQHQGVAFSWANFSNRLVTITCSISPHISSVTVIQYVLLCLILL